MKANCWLSPEGKFYYGLCHQDIAEKIVKEVYGLTEDTSQNKEPLLATVNPQRFLEKLGWMKYMNGWFLDPRATATQAQINAVFIEYGDDISKMGSLYGSFPIFISCFIVAINRIKFTIQKVKQKVKLIKIERSNLWKIYFLFSYRQFYRQRFPDSLHITMLFMGLSYH